jgi:CheY-like chemotaxis protein
MNGKKLLVADDSLTIQKVIRLALASDGYEIQTVSDGNEALQQLSLFRPDLVLIDVALPGQTAFDVRRWASKQADLADVRFVLLSSAFEEVDEAQYQALGFAGRLTKPFDPAHLRQVLGSVLGTEAPPTAPGPTPPTPPRPQGLGGRPPLPPAPPPPPGAAPSSGPMIPPPPLPDSGPTVRPAAPRPPRLPESAAQQPQSQPQIPAPPRPAAPTQAPPAPPAPEPRDFPRSEAFTPEFFTDDPTPAPIDLRSMQNTPPAPPKPQRPPLLRPPTDDAIEVAPNETAFSSPAPAEIEAPTLKPALDPPTGAIDLGIPPAPLSPETPPRTGAFKLAPPDWKEPEPTPLAPPQSPGTARSDRRTDQRARRPSARRRRQAASRQRHQAPDRVDDPLERAGRLRLECEGNRGTQAASTALFLPR